MDQPDQKTGIVATALMGAAAGAVAVWALDRVDWFMWNRLADATRRKTVSVRPGGEPPSHVLAAKVEKRAGLGPTGRQHDIGGDLVHYAIGVMPAVGYALIRHRLPGRGWSRGLLYGLGAFLVQDEALNTAAGLAARPRRYPWQAHARGLIAHLVYGVTTELVLDLLERAAGSDRRTAESLEAAGAIEPLAGFSTFAFTHGGRERTVYRAGTGPAVLVMHEVPGISTEVIRFARKVVDAGFTVFMPRLFGPVGVKTSPLNRLPELAKVCISREFHVLAENRSSPIVDWLRALGRHAFDEVGGRGVGAVGMCVTGNFALTLTLDPWVLAPVMGHPSLPLPLTPAKAAALHVTPQTLVNARRRIESEGLKVLGVRFHGDALFCRAARFATLRRELGDGFEGIELPAGSAKLQPEPPHSVLTIGLIDREGEPTRAAVDRVLGFLAERLR